MKKLFSFVCALVCAIALNAESVTYKVTVPEGTKACYIAGACTGWGHKAMTKESETQYTFTIDTDNKDGYKYCSGPAWDYEELNADGNKIDDRTYSESDVVAKWKSVYDPETVSEKTYVVIGAVDFLGGWDFNKAPALAKQEDGSYAYTIEGIALSAGDIEYKMATKEDGWNGWKLPADKNNKFNIAESGTYNLTFTLSADLSTQDAKATLVSAGDVIPVIQLMGTLTDWGTGKTMIASEDNLTAEISLDLTAETTYQLKITKNGSWLGNDGTMTSENCTGWTFTSDGGDCGLTTTIAGSYKFVWEYATDKLSVTYPSSTPTAVSNIEVENVAVKVIRDGQVLIVREGVTYNLMGQTIQ